MQTKDGNNKEQKSMKLKQKNNKIKAGFLKRSIKLTEKKKIQIINIRNDIGISPQKDNTTNNSIHINLTT